MDDILEDMRWKFMALRVGTRDRLTLIYERDKMHWIGWRTRHVDQK